MDDKSMSGWKFLVLLVRMNYHYHTMSCTVRNSAVLFTFARAGELIEKAKPVLEE